LGRKPIKIKITNVILALRNVASESYMRDDNFKKKKNKNEYQPI
jgi:hypothetical protein